MIQYWKHQITGEIYAVDMLDQEITNAYGPLTDTYFRARMARNLNFNYDHAVDLTWLKQHQDDFSLLQPELHPLPGPFSKKSWIIRMLNK
ncbi:hypothetical protein [Candidatus Formimonas warabiya]|uniref:Uncharacterized protein n=1 Tax=Formimonas warabiya TaxID=1761012 RepID=A0A3G1KR22_FORW1|nr:hypothetical protein [Candidatus Formimonas warabiya]ATW24555.1 hypothetical protein DCMF_06950 [Candidatus Formimonas warabiya]